MVDPDPLGRWLATFMGPKGESALLAARVFAVVLIALGLASVAALPATGLLLAGAWCVVGAYHTLALVLPRLGSCPCLGVLSRVLGGASLHVFLAAVGIIGTACGLVLWVGVSRPMMAGRTCGV